MNTSQKVSDTINIQNHFKKIFNVQHTVQNYKPDLIKTLQAKIPEIKLDVHNDKSKLNIIYELFLQHMSQMFYNSGTHFNIQEPLSTSVRNTVYLNYIDMFILKNSKQIDNKYIQELEQLKISQELEQLKISQDLLAYSIFCLHFNINKSDIHRIVTSINVSMSKDNKYIVYYRKGGVYEKFIGSEHGKEKNIDNKLVFKIYVNGRICCLNYIVQSNTLELLYSDYGKGQNTFDKQVLYILFTTLFTTDLQYTSINLKNLDDDKFDERFDFIRDVKLWICICMSFLTPNINISVILDYINSLPYLRRDIFYLNMIVFIFEHSGYIKEQPINFSGILHDIISDQRLINITDITTDDSNVQKGGSLGNGYYRKNTIKLIRDWFIIR